MITQSVDEAKPFFFRKICMKKEFSSQRRKTLLRFLIVNQHGRRDVSFKPAILNIKAFP